MNVRILKVNEVKCDQLQGVEMHAVNPCMSLLIHLCQIEFRFQYDLIIKWLIKSR